MRSYSTLSSGTTMAVLLWTKCLNALQRKEDLSNTSSWRVGVVLLPHLHFTCWCFYKVLQTLIFNTQNPSSSYSECLGNWMGNRYPYFALKGYICFMQQSTANSCTRTWQLLTVLCTWCGAGWHSMAIPPGSSSGGAVRRAASSTLAALSTAPCGCCS